MKMKHNRWWQTHLVVVKRECVYHKVGIGITNQVVFGGEVNGDENRAPPVRNINKGSHSGKIHLRLLRLYTESFSM